MKLTGKETIVRKDVDWEAVDEIMAKTRARYAEEVDWTAIDKNPSCWTMLFGCLLVPLGLLIFLGVLL